METFLTNHRQAIDQKIMRAGDAYFTRRRSVLASLELSDAPTARAHLDVVAIVLSEIWSLAYAKHEISDGLMATSSADQTLRTMEDKNVACAFALALHCKEIEKLMDNVSNQEYEKIEHASSTFNGHNGYREKLLELLDEQ